MTSKLDAYSSLKATRHLDIIQEVRAHRAVRPAHVQVVLSDACNQSCQFCAYRDPTYSSSQMFYEIMAPDKKNGLRRDAEHPERNYNPNRLIPFDKVIEIIDDCAEMGVSGVQFTGGGEPTVHPKFMEILKATVDRKLAFSVVSNGVILGKMADNGKIKAERETFERASWYRISLDAARKETYCRIRNVPPQHYFQALDAIRELSALKGPVVGVGFVVTPDNWQEVYEAAVLVRQLGAGNIRISAQFSAQEEKLFAGFHEECAQLCRAAVRDFNDETFQVYERFSAKLDDLKLKAPDYERCGYQHYTTYIGGDLNVYRCCVQAYNEHGLVGSLKEQRFRDLWMSQERADKMHAFEATSCDRCQFNGINRNLDYILREDDPAHAEFV